MRLLLDQNFPTPIIDLKSVDATVEAIPLHVFDASLTQPRTPDWLIYLRAAEGAFDAVVTRDSSQLDDAPELVALMDTGLNIVNWQTAIEDPIVEWGQVLAFMPQIRAKLIGAKSVVIRLPKPRLDSRQLDNARAILGRMASSKGPSFPEIRDSARTAMRVDLSERGLGRLVPMLGP